MRFTSLAGSLVVLLSGAAVAAPGDPLVVTGNGVNVRIEPKSNAKVVLQVYRNDAAVEVAREGEWIEVQLPDRGVTGWIHGSLVASAGAAQPAVAVAEPAPPAVAAAGLAPSSPQVPPPAPPSAATASPGPAVGPTPLVPPQPSVSLQPKERADDDRSAALKPGVPQLAAVEGQGGTGGGDPLARFRDSVSYLNNRAVAAAGIDLFTGVRGLGDGVVQVTATDAWTSVPEGGQESFLNTLFDRWLAAAGAVEPLRVEVVDRDGHVLKEKSGP